MASQHTDRTPPGSVRYRTRDNRTVYIVHTGSQHEPTHTYRPISGDGGTVRVEYLTDDGRQIGDYGYEHPHDLTPEHDSPNTQQPAGTSTLTWNISSDGASPNGGDTHHTARSVGGGTYSVGRGWHDGQWVPTLVHADGREEHLGFHRSEADAKAAANAREQTVTECGPTLQTTDADPHRVAPVHDVTTPAKLLSLNASMTQQGWVGTPLVVFATDGDPQAITGSHRLAAAREVGIDVPTVDIDDILAAYSDRTWAQIRADHCVGDDWWDAAVNLYRYLPAYVLDMYGIDAH